MKPVERYRKLQRIRVWLDELINVECDRRRLEDLESAKWHLASTEELYRQEI